MKVSEVLKFRTDHNDQWTDQPTDLSHLFKKQASATHAFKIELYSLARKFPENHSYLHEIARSKSLGLSLSFIDGIINPAIVKGLSKTLDCPALQDKYDRMVYAKNRYEKAGGDYNMW